MEPAAQQFRLSFGKMAAWVGRYALFGTGVAFVVAIMTMLPLFFLSKLPLRMIGGSLMLAIIPVGIVILLMGPLLFGSLWLLARFFVYEVNELGIELRFGLPALATRNRVDWLTVESVEEASPFGMEVLRLYELRKETPTTVFTMFLQHPQGFYQAIADCCPPTGRLYHYVCGIEPDSPAGGDTGAATSFASLLQGGKAPS